MANQYFKFKQFNINQDKCAMKVGTDGVLLGAWVSLNKEQAILDIGAGTGLISLMLAQRTNARIDAIEIDYNAYLQALDNVKHSPWANQINIYNQPLQEFRTNRMYDLVITNPPYFSNSQVNPLPNKSKARHDNFLKQEDILAACKKLLPEDGKLALILPFKEGIYFIEKAASKSLFCIRKTYVKPTPSKSPKRLLLELAWKKEPLIENYITIENNKRHDYTKEYIELTKDFYLNF